MQIETNFRGKIEGRIFGPKTVCAYNGMCTLNIFSYEISLSCDNLENMTVILTLDMATLSMGLPVVVKI
jgi:hypothetical protein